MYSGITQGLFAVTQLDHQTGLTRYRVELNDALLAGLETGASVNVDGVCQTVTAIDGHEVAFDAMLETLTRTTLDALFPGRMVSIERSLKHGQDNGGHEVFGHVTGTATVAAITKSDNNLSLTLQCPADWMKVILPKGFVAVDGSSLTVGETDSSGKFDIHLVPETLRLTNFSTKKRGDRVNIELDARTQTIVDTTERVLSQKLATQN